MMVSRLHKVILLLIIFIAVSVDAANEKDDNSKNKNKSSSGFEKKDGNLSSEKGKDGESKGGWDDGGSSRK